MPAVRRLAALVVLAGLLASGCGRGEEATTTTVDTRQADAAEFAVSAQRALDGTRFESLGDGLVAGLVLEACDQLGESSDPDAAVVEVVDRIDAPEGEPIDDEIMAVVLAEGALAVCPEAVDAAAVRAFRDAPPEEQFLVSIAAVAPVLEFEVTDTDLIDAGRIVCSVLDGGGTPEEAVVAEFEALFDVEASNVDEIAAGELGEREGLLAGGVLGAAASFLCPQHRDGVTAYLERLAEENAE